MLFKGIILSVILFLLTSCQPPGLSDYAGDDDYQIGQQLSNMSGMMNADGTDKNKIAIFDETVRKIHLFDLDTNKVTSTINTVETTQQDKHAVLYDQNGNYVVDITTGGFAITNKFNVSNINPVQLFGKPRSAAFRPDLGLLVVYDDVGSVGLLKLSAQGEVLKSWVGGSRIDPNDSSTISSGDLLNNGHLIASMSDGRLANIDIEQTLIDRKWSFVAKTTGLPLAKWISRMPSNNNQILIRMNEDEIQKIYLFDLTTETILDSYSVTARLEKSSRSHVPHIMVSSSNSEILEIIYPVGNALQKIKMPRKNVLESKTILFSQLNLSQDSLSFVEVATQSAFFDENFNYNSFMKKRTYKKFRFSDMLMATTLPLPNDVSLEMSSRYILALFPHKLGYAVSYGTDAKQQNVFQFFNRGNLKKQ